MINKVVNNVSEALKGVTSNMTFMLGGFGLCGIPENAIILEMGMGTDFEAKWRKKYNL